MVVTKTIDESNERDNKIVDFISGKLVNATPEEIDAVQPFSKKLVYDYEYPKTNIQTRKQYRVKARPSDTRGYPVDIAIFSSNKNNDDTAYIMVECKAQTRDDGRLQLENYLKFSKARMGVWFNGAEFLALLKIESDGNIEFDEISDIPKFNERLEDIGKYKRKDLINPYNLTLEFKAVRNYLAANARNKTTDVALAQELIHIILCKLYDERHTGKESTVQFRAGFNESAKDVSNRINDIFQKTKKEYVDVFEESDSISLDPKSILYVVGKLQKYCLIEADRDSVADAFEIFIGPSLRGAQGQFFTPRNVVKTVIDIIDPKPDEFIIDPACGSGGFLSECLRHVHKQIKKQGDKFNWSLEEIEAQKIRKVSEHLRGIERDSFLSKVAKSYMIILGDGKSGIITEDALNPTKEWHTKSRATVKLGSFDVVVTNPPFGAKLPVKGLEKLKQFELCYKWKKEHDVWIKKEVREKQAPQIAFIDRCLELLKEGGRLGIVLPDGILGNSTYEYIRYSLSTRTELIGLVDIPANAFRPSTNTKTHLLFLRKTKEPRTSYDFFLSYALTCGHDKRRNPIDSDDMGDIPNFIKKLKSKKVAPSHLGMFIKNTSIKDNLWLPKYYNLNVMDDLKQYETNDYDLTSISDLVNRKIVKLMSSGKSVKADSYGDGVVPYIRTSDIANLEVNEDPSHCLSSKEYDRVKKSQDIQECDILMVKDGTFLIGKTAMITDMDIQIVLQSHFTRLRVIDDTKISPYLLLGLLNMDIVRKQFDSKIITQSSISTIGKRINELVLPIPKSNKEKTEIIEVMKNIMSNKRKIKQLSRKKYLTQEQNLLGYKNNGHQGNL